MGSLKLYFDFLSQPSRAVYILLKHHKIPFEPVFVDIKTGQQRSQEMKKVTRFQKLPVIDDNGFKVVESVAILRYLARAKNLPDTFYSQDLQKQARIDEYLEWQHLNTRYPLSIYFMNKFILPVLLKKPTNPEKLAALEKNVATALDSFEKFWLEPGPFVTGEQVTAADLWAACEIIQLAMTDCDPRENRPVLAKYLENVKQHFNPSYDEVHAKMGIKS